MTFVDERERELFAAASLSEDARTFLLSHPIGQYLHHRAKAAIAQAEVDALQVDPDKPKAKQKLRAIRASAAAARSFISWMSEVITDGDQAGEELKDYRS